MKKMFDVLQNHIGEEDEVDFLDFFQNMNEVAHSCNILKIKDQYAGAMMRHIESDLFNCGEGKGSDDLDYFIE